MVHSVHYLKLCQPSPREQPTWGARIMGFLYDQSGKRKYLTIDERRAFLEAASTSLPEIRTFCATLTFTGARISEVLALTPGRIDYSDNLIIIECLKKRKPNIYRAVPVPSILMNLLNETHKIRRRQRDENQAHVRIWPWCRTTAWKNVTAIMTNAGIDGPHACPKGLRHSFGVTALQKNVPLNMVRKWLGHSRLSTTAIYADAMGAEERSMALRFWKTFD